MKESGQRMHAVLSILGELAGSKVGSDSKLLDLGCGNGELVNEYLKEGYDTYGCDVKFKAGNNIECLTENDRIRKIQMEPYRLPFDDNTFDFIVTDQVFEHVKDYPSTLSEIHRVLKPHGISLNFFPSRYQIIEPHVFVPFASMYRKYNWLLFWAYMGIRKSSQKGWTARQTADRNYSYLNSSTFYLTKSQIIEYCRRYFTKIRFSEDVFMRHLKRYKFLSLLSKTRVIPWFYSTMRHRVLVLYK